MTRTPARIFLVALAAGLLLGGKALVPKNGIARVPFGIVPSSSVFETQISANGRWVTFRTVAENMLEGGNDPSSDIFLVDTKKGDIVQVSRTHTGGDPTGSCQSPVISATGRFVAYRTSDPDIVEGDELNTNDIFLFDRIKETTVRISTALNGGGATMVAWEPSISKNGRFVAFSSAANLLVAGDLDNTRDVFLRDVKLGVTTLLSPTPPGAAVDGASESPKISANGRFVVFESSAALLPEDDNGALDVYRRDLKLDTLELVSINADGLVGDASSSNPDISDNGRYVTFVSGAKNLVAGATAFVSVFRRDMKKGMLELVNANPDGVPSASIASAHSISPDGRFVAFGSLGTDLGPEDLNLHTDIYLKDMKKGDVTRVSLGFGGVETDDTSAAPSASKKGKFIAFESLATTLLEAGDGNFGTDIYVARP